MKKTSFKVDEKGKNCWRCGIEFDNSDLMKRKTYHHSIADRYNPLINLKVPVCQKCHYEMNKDELFYKKVYNEVIKLLKIK